MVPSSGRRRSHCLGHPQNGHNGHNGQSGQNGQNGDHRTLHTSKHHHHEVCPSDFIKVQEYSKQYSSTGEVCPSDISSFLLNFNLICA